MTRLLPRRGRAELTRPDVTTPRTALFAACAGREALEDDPPRYADAVSWLSAHLATLTAVVVPAVRQSLPQQRDVLEQHAAAAHGLEHELRRLHGRLSGDGAMAHLDPDRLRRSVLLRLDVQAALQERLLLELHAAVPADRWAQLVGQYTHGVLHSPTRPHPHLPHTGAAGRLAQQLARVGDRFLDVVDSRPVHALASGYLCEQERGTGAAP
jgi:hypothetical protein